MVQKADKIWFDGKLVPWDEAQVHVLTHTLHYGVGVFEGIRCYTCTDGGSAVFRLQEHVERLFLSAKINEMVIPFTQDQIKAPPEFGKGVDARFLTGIGMASERMVLLLDIDEMLKAEALSLVAATA